jgi:hypothetical protein
MQNAECRMQNEMSNAIKGFFAFMADIIPQPLATLSHFHSKGSSATNVFSSEADLGGIVFHFLCFIKHEI